MCIIIPVDHIPCTHTVAIWQHCVNAPRSRIHGLEPCGHIRQHSRPILTGKYCYNCGGPRFFSRRGGIAERGRGSDGGTEADTEAIDEHSSDNHYDSGYQSNVIHEENEGDDPDAPVSPRAPRVLTRRRRDERRSSSPSRHQSPTRTSNWRPNLKRDMTKDADLLRRQPSIESVMSKFDNDKQSKYDAGNEDTKTSLQKLMAPKIRRPALLPRKTSTLLHPSTPGTETTPETASDPQTDTSGFPFSTQGQRPTTPPTTPPQRPSYHRKGSTLLHPSSPPSETAIQYQNEKSFPFNFQLPTAPSPTSSPPLQRPSSPCHQRRPSSPILARPSSPINRILAETTITITSQPVRPTTTKKIPATRPGMPPRKSSTLLHPSSPHATQSSPAVLTTMQNNSGGGGGGNAPSSLPEAAMRHRTAHERQFHHHQHQRSLSANSSSSNSTVNAHHHIYYSEKRRGSVLHSSLSDAEDDDGGGEDGTGSSSASSRSRSRSRTSSPSWSSSWSSSLTVGARSSVEEAGPLSSNSGSPSPGSSSTNSSDSSSSSSSSPSSPGRSSSVSSVSDAGSCQEGIGIKVVEVEHKEKSMSGDAATTAAAAAVAVAVAQREDLRLKKMQSRKDIGWGMGFLRVS